MTPTWLFLALVFVVTTALVWLVMARWMQHPLQQRLQALRDQTRSTSIGATDGAPFRLSLQSLPPWLRASMARLATLALPGQTRQSPHAAAAQNHLTLAENTERPWESFALRWRFLNAGLRDPQAPLLHFAFKALLTFALPAALLGWVAIAGPFTASWKILGLAIVLAMLGYWLPDAVLQWRIARRQRELMERFPDALDLMLVCVEAGQSLDAAIDRVASDIALQSRALAEELRLLTLELRTGGSRAEALQHLALRVGLDEVDALISTLVQADRFGTPVGEALRVHSRALRDHRRLRAEEAAAKLPVKLLLPLIFCVFPGLLVVLMGPPAIRAIRLLFPMLGGH